MDSKTAVSNILAHHGVKGMKWGVRKARGETREVSAETSTNRVGKATIKTSGGENHPAHPDAIAARVIRQKLVKSGSHSLSNAEIQQLANRYNLENQLTKVPKSAVGYTQATQHVSKVLSSPTGKAGISLVRNTSTNRKVKTAAAVAAALAG